VTRTDLGKGSMDSNVTLVCTVTAYRRKSCQDVRPLQGLELGTSVTGYARNP
jgi:hypothetical protein